MKKHLSYIFILALFISCQQDDGSELTLNDLQKDEVAASTKFRFSATIDVFAFNSNMVNLSNGDSVFVIRAINGAKRLSFTLPSISVREYSGSSSNKVNVIYVNEEERLFESNNPLLTSDAIIKVTKLDTAANVFSGTFSATVYDPTVEKPQRSENNIFIYEGEFRDIAY